MYVINRLDSNSESEEKQYQEKDINIKKNKEIYFKFFCIIFFSLLIACVIMGVLINLFVKNVCFNRYSENYLNAIHSSVQSEMNNYINQVTSFSNYIFDDGIIYNIFKNSEKTELDKKVEIQKYLNESYNELDLVANVDIVVREDFVIRMREEEIDKVDDEFKSKLRHTNIVLSDELVKNYENKHYFVFGRRVNSATNNKKLFDVYIYLPEEKIYEVLAKLNVDDNLFFLMADDKIVSHPQKDVVGNYMMMPTGLSRNNGKNHYIGDNLYYHYLLDLNVDEIGDWYMGCCINYRWFYSTIEELRYTTIVIVVLMIFFALLLSIIIPRKLIRSIFFLKKRMKAFSKSGKDDAYTDFDFKEIAELERSFKDMVDRINDLAEKNNMEKEKQRKAELRALQAQINPHFIYNTLDVISWHARLNKQNYLADMICELSMFFRIGLHKGDTLIKVSEEIRHVESYVAITQLRFPKLFEFSHKIQDDIMDELIPKIILQPIVENCVKHAFKNIESGGEIKIVGYKDEEDIIFEIEDNGCGIEYKPIQNDEKTTGYGLKNVNERIKLEYGEEYGISIKENFNSGTVVKIRLKRKQDF